jgi:hypothetical protein
MSEDHKDRREVNGTIPLSLTDLINLQGGKAFFEYIRKQLHEPELEGIKYEPGWPTDNGDPVLHVTGWAPAGPRTMTALYKVVILQTIRLEGELELTHPIGRDPDDSYFDDTDPRFTEDVEFYSAEYIITRVDEEGE